MSNQTTPGRISWFDELRGLMIINMVFYHLLYDFVNLYDLNLPWFNGIFGELWQEVISCTFILIAGACSFYSRNNLKRGLKLLAWAYLLTLITYLTAPDFLISFGILHLMGFSMLLFIPLQPALERIPVSLKLPLFVMLYLLTIKVSQGYLGFGIYKIWKLPAVWYQTDFLYMLGLPSEHFYSSDYFPLLPYFFMFLAGTCLGQLNRLNRLPAMITKGHQPFLAFVGKHSLTIYLLHQPVLLAILWLIF
ncbi:MAG: heparan-alpha-glucosaminide N-acetyltransferase [Bacteroidales bacterium]|nr:heparan-alpha-glucosaminide N-acetyltransferase [Bacteroidales bacterium]